MFNINTNVLASSSKPFYDLNYNEINSTDCLTDEEIQKILNYDLINSRGAVQISPYLRLNVRITEMYTTHTAKLTNMSNDNTVARKVKIVQNVYYETSSGIKDDYAVTREVGDLYPGRTVTEIFSGLKTYYKIDKIAYFAYTTQPVLSMTNPIWVEY